MVVDPPDGKVPVGSFVIFFYSLFKIIKVNKYLMIFRANGVHEIHALS